jgi:hypothetical protein
MFSNDEVSLVPFRDDACVRRTCGLCASERISERRPAAHARVVSSAHDPQELWGMRWRRQQPLRAVTREWTSRSTIRYP